MFISLSKYDLEQINVLDVIRELNTAINGGGDLALVATTADKDKFQSFFSKVVEVFVVDPDPSVSYVQRTEYCKFLVSVFKNLDDAEIRSSALKYLNISIWQCLSAPRLRKELDGNSQVKKYWERNLLEINEMKSKEIEEIPVVEEKKAKGQKGRKRKVSEAVTTPIVISKAAEPIEWRGVWFPKLIRFFLDTVETSRHENDPTVILYLEKFLELLIDLLSQISTRRFLNTLLDDLHVIVRCRRSSVYKSAHGKLFQQLVEMLCTYAKFEIDDQTGNELTTPEIVGKHNLRLHRLQRLAFTEYKDVLKDLVFSSTGQLGKSDILSKHFSLLTDEQLSNLAYQLGYITESEAESVSSQALPYVSRELVLDIMLDNLCYRESQLERLTQMPLIPNEKLLWDRNQVPMGSRYGGEEVLALPKLNLQFLTMHDYLLRNFKLFQLESAYEIREDLVDAIKRMGPRPSLGGQVTFGGWARMALPVQSFQLEDVQKPNLGEVVPSAVRASIQIDLSRFRGEIRAEWESLRDHDVVFLVCIRNPHSDATNALQSFEKERALMAKGRKPNRGRDFQWSEEELDFPERFGVAYVRGGEVFEVRDEDDVVLNDPSKPDERKSGRVGSKRKIRLQLDPAQYYADIKGDSDCYSTLNLLVRRKPKENNFKAVLETIRDLMNMAAIGRAIPSWLHDVFLGYGNPNAANYRSLAVTRNVSASTTSTSATAVVETLDFGDTFLDAEHLIESFPEAEVTFSPGDTRTPPFRLVIVRGEKSGDKEQIEATSYRPLNMGPYPEDQPPKNPVRFTPVQVEAIRSGLNQGLTLVVGPPGTGKTDVAVQIICGLYRNNASHKILIVAHSNAALNDLFEKIMQRDVDPRHLLRLGSGESDLRETLARGGAGGSGRGKGEEFSKQGRVNWSLARRLQLLSQVQRLATSLGVTGDVGYTCETASYFQLEFVQSRVEKYTLELQAGRQAPDSDSLVGRIFPFHGYFADVSGLFVDNLARDTEIAEGCFRHIAKLFAELSDYRAFELLRTQAHRGDYLLTKQARIVAMTCTHAAMTRRRLVELGFKYDSLIMEEAGQILEVETLVPMLLQDVDLVDGCRLKRAILIGDHHQLPPVVKHAAFQKHSKLDQPMFTRLVRLGVPTILLDRQGRARPEIAALYSWRYCGAGKSLGNLSFVAKQVEYQQANAGLALTYQLVDVPDFQGRGEFCPTPFFYQNLGEAEYIVAVYQYMRLLGYPAERISILATYNGQKHLIRDILSQRCRSPVFGMPASVSTVDKYQGQQNDYILLSLVRTESVGHLRDVRRLVVAMSRARLGLYIFGRQSLFAGVEELSGAFKQLMARPTKLELVVGEGWPTNRLSDDQVPSDKVHTLTDVKAMGVLVYQMVQQSQHLQAAQLQLSHELTPVGELVIATGPSEASAGDSMDLEDDDDQ